MRATPLLSLALTLAACSSDGGDIAASINSTAAESTTSAQTSTTTAPSRTSTTMPTPATPPTGVTAIDLCVGAVHEPGPAIADERLTEISGAAFSRTDTATLYAHNDSGDVARVFVLADDGTTTDVVLVDAIALDWEDIATTADAIFVADIGDNLGLRPSVRIIEIDEATRFPTSYTVTYPGGRPNAEALIVDETGSTATIISKDGDGRARIFEAALDPAADVIEAVQVGVLALEGTVSAADLSADGALIAVRTYGAVWLFDRAADQTVGDALQLAPCEAASVSEVQGEAIAIHIDGRGYTTLSEGLNPTRNDFRLP